MNKRNISDILRQSIHDDDALTYEQKAEMWNNIERKVVSTRMPQKKSSSSGFFAGAGTVAVIALVVFFGGKYLISHHTVKTTTASHQTSPAIVTTAPAKNNSSTANTSNNSVPSSVPSTSQNATSSTPSNVVVHSYASASQATSAIDAIQQGYGKIYPSGPNLNLGNGISAQESGSLGLLFLRWTEGRWAILADLLTSDSIPMAKQIVSYLHTHTLPAPQFKGVIGVAQSSNSSSPTIHTTTTIAWQVGNKVYEIQQTGNPINALQAAVNHG